MSERTWMGTVLIALLLSGPVWAGKLGEFEEDATKGRTNRRTETDHDHDHHHDHDHNDDTWEDCCVPDFWGDFFEVAFIGVYHGGAVSLARMMPVPEWSDEGEETSLTHLEPRESGDPLIPLVRFDMAYHNIESDVSAVEYRGEVGYGPLALAFQQTHYQEDNPADELDLFYGYAIYRMSFGSKLEVDAGCGVFAINGEEHHSGGSFMLGVLFYPIDNVGVEFRPTRGSISGSHTDTYDLSALFGMKHLSVKAGYRWVHSPREELNGPYAGLTIRY